jgi:hypothetical protein
MALQALLNDRISLRAGLLLIFAAALGMRLAYSFGSSRGGRELIGDAGEYHSYAVNLLEQGRYQNQEGLKASRMPGYPLFLAAVYAVFGRSVAAVEILQCAIGAATCGLIFLLAWEWLGKGWGLGAGLASACYYDLFSSSARLLTETLVAFFLTLVFWFWGRRPIGESQRAVFIGISAAAAYLLRPEFCFYAALLAGIAVYDNYLVQKQAPWKSPLIILVCLGLAALPWAARNKHILGRAVKTSTAGPVNVYLGIPRTIHDRLGGLQKSFTPLEHLDGLELTELEAMDHYSALVPRLFREASLAQIIRAIVFNLAIEYYPFLPEYDGTLVFFLPFWAWGACLTCKDRRYWPLLALLGYLTLLHSVVAVMQARHRQVLGSALILLSFAGLRDLRWRFSGSAFPWLIAGWAFLQGFIWFFGPVFRQLALSVRNLI